jgi:tetraacyldisaccharide 4'-kinase
VNPLSSIYAALSSTRNHLYDRGIFNSRRLLRPVISIGNISVGGSGKTPFVILLGELLKQRGFAFDVLSRGYGRITKGVLVVDPNGSPRYFGDEPLLIARRLGCSVIVGESRYKAGVFAEKKFNSELHLLDDGFQHRSLARDFDIVLLTPEDLHDQLLPVGRLREPLPSLCRADALVLTEEIDPGLLPGGKLLWRVRRSLSVPDPPQNPVVFCGIARPHKFEQQLHAAGIRPVAKKFYRDHPAYSSEDVRTLINLQGQHDAGGFITTEKDAINLGSHLATLGPVAVARVEMELVNAADALDTMLRLIADRRSKREKIL